MRERRALVATLVARGVPERLACRVVGLARSSYRYQPKGSDPQEAQLRATIGALAQQHRRYGYRRITALLRRDGWRINPKRVWRLWQAAGLSLPRRRPKRRTGGPRRDRPTRATSRGHVWTYDFAYDVTERGQALKLLVVVDEYTRECHQIRVGYRLDSQAVLETLAELVARHGAPGYLRSDNGGEFIAERVRGWLDATGIATITIEPGHPWENGYAESFIGKLRDECLNEEVFWNAWHAQIVVEAWRHAYNHERPHSSLGYQTPAEVAQASDSPERRPVVTIG